MTDVERTLRAEIFLVKYSTNMDILARVAAEARPG
jgi:hypothetical protein